MGFKNCILATYDIKPALTLGITEKKRYRRFAQCPTDDVKVFKYPHMQRTNECLYACFGYSICTAIKRRLISTTCAE
jgi:hypothetical protein